MLGEYVGPGGLFFVIGLILAIWAVINIAQSGAGALTKAIWIVVVLFIPYLGFIAWLFFGPRASKKG